MSKYDELKRLAEAECISSELGSFENPQLCAAILELIAESERLRNAIAGLLEWVAPIAGDNQDDEASQRELDSLRIAEAAMQEDSK